jgi:hypothetical protein
VGLLRPISKDNDIQWADKHGGWEERHICTFFDNLTYGKHTLHLAEAHITKTKRESKTGELIIETERFVHITDIQINTDNCRQISTSGRLRWKIENEGFNTQKNGGYGLSHKFSRTSHTASCNYYQCLQIAHLINQLAILSKSFKEYFFKDAKESLKSLKEFGMAVLLVWEIDNGSIYRLLELVSQLRY